MTLFYSFNVFDPNIKLYGYLFHHAQCRWRKIQQLGLEIVYKMEPSAKRIHKRCIKLPYFKITRIRIRTTLFCDLVKISQKNAAFSRFIYYFKDTLVGKNFLTTYG